MQKRRFGLLTMLTALAMAASMLFLVACGGPGMPDVASNPNVDHAAQAEALESAGWQARIMTVEMVWMAEFVFGERVEGLTYAVVAFRASHDREWHETVMRNDANWNDEGEFIGPNTRLWQEEINHFYFYSEAYVITAHNLLLDRDSFADGVPSFMTVRYEIRITDSIVTFWGRTEYGIRDYMNYDRGNNW